MALINKVDNQASVTYEGKTILSNTVETLLLLAPTVLKAVDKLTASLGEVLTYTVTVSNPALNQITSVPFSDIIPLGTTYVADSFEVNGTPATPTLDKGTLKYTIPTIGALGTAVLRFQVTVVGGSN